jgi:hypothetical protein
MTLCLAEPVPASGGFVKGDSGLDFQAVMQLEKMGMAEDATVGFLKRQKLPSCFAGEVEPDQLASIRLETNLAGDSEQRWELGRHDRGSRVNAKPAPFRSIKKWTTSRASRA